MTATDSYEFVSSRDPFVIRRTVRWADCDPAGIVFTGRFPDYVLSAVSLFTAHMANGSMHEVTRTLGVDMPCKGMTYEFQHSLWPGDVFDIHCHVGEIRTHTYDILCTGKKPDGTAIFAATVSPICIKKEVRQRVPIPQTLRDIFAQHQNSAGVKP